MFLGDSKRPEARQRQSRAVGCRTSSTAMLSYRRWSGRSSCDLALPDQRDEFVLSTTGGSPRKTRILVPFFDHVGLLLVNNVSVVLEN